MILFIRIIHFELCLALLAAKHMVEMFGGKLNGTVPFNLKAALKPSPISSPL